MPNAYQQRTFKQAKIRTIRALLIALEEEKIPNTTGYSLTTGQIADYFDDHYLPLQPRSLLAVLREAGIPHDSRNRFLTWQIYSHKEDLEALHKGYLKEAGLDLTQLASLPMVEYKEGDPVTYMTRPGGPRNESIRA